MATGLDVSHGLNVQQWDDVLFSEYLGKIVYKPFMSTGLESAILVKENLIKGSGDLVHAGLRSGLDGAGVQGDSTLEGSEEEITFYDHTIRVTQERNAVLLAGNLSEKRAAFDLRNQAKDALAEWHAQLAEARIATQFNAINGVVYGSASEGQKDAWLADNSDRVIFGALKSNNSSNDHSASLLNVDGSADKLTTSLISVAKRMAKLSTPKIRPIKIEGGVEFYLMFVTPNAFRDLLGDTAIQNAQRDVFPRLGNNHPLLNGQSFVMWDGVMVVESERVLNLSGVGASSIDVAGNVLLGAQSLVYAQGGYKDGMRMKWIEKSFDYDNQQGFSAGQIYGVSKSVYPITGASVGKDHGVVTVYTSNVGDA